MSLERVEIGPLDSSPLPGDVEAFIREGEWRIRDWIEGHPEAPIHGFVPSDFVLAWRVLRTLADRAGVGRSFCEWGSGWAVVTGLAARLGFEATGIEIQPPLADASREFLAGAGVRAEILEGSFLPEGYRLPEDLVPAAPLTLFEEAGALDEVDVDIDDFDVIYAYPWPGEEDLYRDLFSRRAADGAWLVLYLGVREGVETLRKR